jgi:transcriptional regulator with XRE-family HTH domain
LNKPRKQQDRRASQGFPNPIDVHVGKRIRSFREAMGTSQTHLAEAIGLTFQQVQKYERGANRVSSSRLFDMAKYFGKPIADFFADMPDDIKRQSPGQLANEAVDPDLQAIVDDATGIGKEGLHLARAYTAIQDKDARNYLRWLVQAIASLCEGLPVATATRTEAPRERAKPRRKRSATR